MPSTIRLYEVVYVIAPDRSEEQVQTIVNKYANLITNQGGDLIKSDVWERRRLAYEINGFHEGVYIVVHFRGVPKVEAELRRVFRISEDTLRYVIIRPDDESVLNTPPPESQQRYYQQEPRPAAVFADIPAPAAQVEAAPIVESAPAIEKVPDTEATVVPA
jgi:small subunit ribosomal protein S6